MNYWVEPSALSGAVRAPASKSSLQRALACAALAPGVSTIRNPLWSADCLATARAAEALGASVERGPDRVTVRGITRISADGEVPRKTISISCGESGTCLRMFSAIASLFPRDITLVGEGSLARRPMDMLVEPLRALGAECSTNGGIPPVRVRGPLRAGSVRVDGGSSSQFLSGLLISLPMVAADSIIYVENLVSRGYVDLTLSVMRAFGAKASRNPDYTEFHVQGGCPYRPSDYNTEGDWSGAAFLLVAGALAARGKALEVTGLDASSTQPDRAILDALQAAGAGLKVQGDRATVQAAPLRAFRFDATDCPDLFPPLAALAAFCEGETRLRGTERLRAKESDRAAALSEEFGKLGINIRVDGNEMRIRGQSYAAAGAAPSSRRPPARIDSRGDHRIAMAAAVAALAGTGPVEILGAECVSKSYPDFFQDIASLGARVFQ